MTTNQARILLVDDDQATVRMMDLALSLEGFEIEVRGSRDEALEMVESWAPRLVVMDYYIGGLDAATFLTRLRETSYDGAVLLCTASDQEFDLPVDSVLRKPFDPEDLVRQVRSLLKPNGS
jgi:DNA-binding response OmpR family regulator